MILLSGKSQCPVIFWLRNVSAPWFFVKKSVRPAVYIPVPVSDKFCIFPDRSLMWWRLQQKQSNEYYASRNAFLQAVLLKSGYMLLCGSSNRKWMQCFTNSSALYKRLHVYFALKYTPSLHKICFVLQRFSDVRLLASCISISKFLSFELQWLRLYMKAKLVPTIYSHIYHIYLKNLQMHTLPLKVCRASQSML
jgi:hypothetical protein